MRNADDKADTAETIMTMNDLERWGVPIVAYVKHVGAEGAGGWGIYGADGTQIGVAPDRATAFAAVRQHDLEPLSVH
jgi:hypothetical protein